MSSNIYDKRDDFDSCIVNFPCLDCNVPCRHISQLIRFARVCSNVYDFNARDKFFNSKTSQTWLSVS